MSNQSNLFVVIPAYNEQARLESVITDLQQYNYNILIVNDGSKDNTEKIILQHPEIYYYKHIINRGMGAALATGTEAALDLGAKVIVHFDADGQMQAKDIQTMVNPIIKNDYDVVLGSRFLADSNKLPFIKKYLIHPVSRIINWLFTGLWLSDVHNGFRALSRSAAKKIQISQDGMAHNTEITQLIARHNLKYKEVPVDIIYHEFGQGIMGGLKIIRDLIFNK